MRTCCISGCFSRANDAERSLFKIVNDRKEWIDIIRQYQVLDESYQLYICDLHFKQNDIQKTNTKTVLRKFARPCNFIRSDNGCFETSSNESPLHSNNSPYDPHVPAVQGVEETLYELSHLNIENDNFSFDENIGTEANSKIISMQEYTKLVNLIPQVEKFKKIIRQLKEEIRKKDDEILELKRCHLFDLTEKKLLNEQREVVDCLINGFRGKQYPENIRRFCLQQIYHSPAAYQSLRTFFNKNLPSKRTVQLWYTSIDGEPGISLSALDIIREKAISHQEEHNHALHVTLMADEMSIRRQICYSSEKQSFVGFSTITNSSIHFQDEKADLKIAKDALVFMIVGPDFKLPIGYHLLNGLEAIDRAALTFECINRIEECGAIVMSFTSDGCPANVATVEFLGAQKDEPFFISPTHPNQKIHVIWDPPHMLKLVRKHFCEKKLYYQDEFLDWDLLRILEEKQRMENFNFCNKLTERHIKWQQKPMNVSLAAQTISKSVSDALVQLHKDGYKDFKKALGTSKFLLMCNDAFDVMNFAENDPTDNRYKYPICEATAGTLFAFLDEFKEYVEQIQIENEGGTSRKPMVDSASGMGFRGFATNVTSLKGIYHDFIQNGPLKYFYTMQMCQDHLESTFSIIRNQQGRNDNPNAIEFRSAFRKLLVCHPQLTSRDHNVVSNATNILTTSSTTKTRTAPLCPALAQDPEFEFELCYESLLAEEISTMDKYQNHMSAYTALLIEQKINQQMKRANKSSCVSCSYVFDENEKINDSLLAMKHNNQNQAIQPCLSTVEIVIFSNAVLKITASSDRNKNINSASKNICDNLDYDGLFNSSDFVHQDKNHKIDFIAQVVKAFLTLKSQYASKRITQEEAGVAIRNRMSAQIHLAGQ